MGDSAKLLYKDRELELPVITGTEQESAVDISKLRAATGFITLDEGYVNTGSTISAITFLDGEQGILRYRGYPIEQLAEHCDFVETSYLLIYGELPNDEQLEDFRNFAAPAHDAARGHAARSTTASRAMPIRWRSSARVVGALSTFYQDSLDPHDPRQVEISVHRLMAKLPTIAAYAYKKSIGQPFMYPQNDLTTARTSCR